MAASADSVFWRPYGYDAGTIGLFHCDGAKVDAAAEPDFADALGTDDTRGGDPRLDLGSGEATVKKLKNANKVGADADLLGSAEQTEGGRFGGGVALKGPGDAIALAGSGAIGTT